jgi:type III restriction enzyme
MTDFEVPNPILSPPFEEPRLHWYIQEGSAPEQRPGRRPSIVFQPQEQTEQWDISDGTLAASKEYPGGYELLLVNRVRERVKAWRGQGYPGTTRTTQALLQWWWRDGRQTRLFFAQLEAAEATIFLREARADLLQGIAVPREEVGGEKEAQGLQSFARYACKMATGSGKTTVMGMLAAWSILNKVHNRGDARFSDVVLIVCPNVTIRDRLRELDSQAGEASLYYTRDLVPPEMRSDLTKGRVLVTNWHVFEPRAVQTDGVSARVSKAGAPVRTRETVTIGSKTTVARDKRYLTLEDYNKQVSIGLLTVLEEQRGQQGDLQKVLVESVRYVESDAALVNRVLGHEVGGKQNILVMNDEAHHAYRIRRPEGDEGEEDLFGEKEQAEEFFREATVWIDGLDRINRLRGINLCVDLSATPYYLGRVGRDANRPFPWVVSDFGLIDAIESGLTKIPQLAVRDTTGAEIPGYFNIWHWILPQLTPAERGGRRGSPKPEAILKFAHHPIAMLGGLWQQDLDLWENQTDDPRPPVFILVAKNTAIAKVLYEWIAEDKPPTGIPPAKVAGFRNANGRVNTIRVDSKVVSETDDLGGAKSEESRWMRFTLDTVGREDWPLDSQGRPLYPEGFEILAKRLKRPFHPPGRDVRCIVSVGMLTEGWDCKTVTHIVGLRPFMSQLLCEQVVGRGLRRASYDIGEDGLFAEEVALVFGVPFQVIPFKASTKGSRAPAPKRHHIHALPSKQVFEITFPRVEGYTQAVRNRIAVDWPSVPTLTLQPDRIPPEVEVKGLNVNNKGRLSLSGPGRADDVTLADFRSKRRFQELIFDLARALARDILAQGRCEIPSHALYPQLIAIVDRYLNEKVSVQPPADLKDIFLSPYYGWVIERLSEAIRPDTSQGEAPEVPRFEAHRGLGSTQHVDYWTSRDVREVNKSHLNYVVFDTKRWEQSAAYYIDKHDAVAAFAKNAGLGFAVPYFHNGQRHDYIPDFLVRMKGDTPQFLILETKGFDPLEEVKKAAALRWVNAVNADGAHGRWDYLLAKNMTISQRCSMSSLPRSGRPLLHTA